MLQPQKRSRKFHMITAAVVVAIFAIAVGIILYTDYSYVNVEITGNSNAYFVLEYSNSTLTVNESQSATIAVLPHANVTLTAMLNPTYTVTGWVVSGASYHDVGNDSINFETGSGGSTVKVSANISGPASGQS